MDRLHQELKTLKQLPSSLTTNKKKAVILNQMGWRVIDVNQFDKGLVYARQALEWARRNNDYEQIAKAQLSIGFAIQKKERFFEAADYFENAKESARKAQNDSLLSMSYHWAGMCYSDQELPRKSLENFQKELLIVRQAHLHYRLVQCLNSMGLAYIKIQQPDSAFYFFNATLNAAVKIKDKIHIGVAYKNMGRILLGKGREEEGVHYLQKSIDYFLTSEDMYLREAVQYSYIALAKYYRKKKQYLRSNYYGKLTWDLANKFNYTDQKAEISQVLYGNYRELGEKDLAIFYMEKYIEASLKINQDLLSEQHIAAEARFRDERQKNQIGVLNRDKKAKENERKWLISGLIFAVLILTVIGKLYRTITKQKKIIEQINLNLEEKVSERTANLEQALEEIKGALLKGQKIERRRVAADLHDNLGAMMSAIRLSIEAIDTSNLSQKEKGVYENVLTMTREAYNEVRLLAHNLQPEELEKFGLCEALQRLMNKLNDTGLIHFSLITNSLERFSKELEFNLYFICLELANNIVKHSGASEASFEFVTVREQLQLFVIDNGKGFIANNTSDGMGMRNIQERTEQMGGTLKIHSESGEGTMFQFVIPFAPSIPASGQTG